MLRIFIRMVYRSIAYAIVEAKSENSRLCQGT